MRAAKIGLERLGDLTAGWTNGREGAAFGRKSNSMATPTSKVGVLRVGAGVGVARPVGACFHYLNVVKIDAYQKRFTLSSVVG